MATQLTSAVAAAGKEARQNHERKLGREVVFSSTFAMLSAVVTWDMLPPRQGESGVEQERREETVERGVDGRREASVGRGRERERRKAEEQEVGTSATLFWSRRSWMRCLVLTLCAGV